MEENCKNSFTQVEITTSFNAFLLLNLIIYDFCLNQLVKEDEGWIIYYIIMIRLQDQLLASATDRNGWVVTRTHRQIKELHHDLCQV